MTEFTPLDGTEGSEVVKESCGCTLTTALTQYATFAQFCPTHR